LPITKQSRLFDLILDDVFQLLVKGHQLLLVSELVRKVKPQPRPQLTFIGLLRGLLGLLVHAEVKVGAGKVYPSVFGNLELKSSLLCFCNVIDFGSCKIKTV